jgi:asparagine synthetase B (glutamine-hydrolysing)
MSHPLASDLRIALIDQALNARRVDGRGAFTTDDVDVFLSGGFDSWSLVFALRLARRKVRAITFCPGGGSDDAGRARFGCDRLGIELTVIPLSFEPLHLVNQIGWMKRNLGIESKAEIECVYPFTQALGAVKAPLVALGHGADDLYGTTKKAALHYADDLLAFRTQEFSKSQRQIDALEKLFRDRGVNTWMPYETPRLRDLFEPYETLASLHKPRMKQPTRDAFREEFESLGFPPLRQGLQMGAGGIAERMAGALLPSPYNVGRHKSVTGVYNRIDGRP